MKTLRKRWRYARRWWLSIIRARRDGQLTANPYDVGFLGEGSFNYWMQRVERERQRNGG